MSLSWWWLGVVAVVAVLAAVLSNLHWTLLDLVMDRLPRRGSEWWRSADSEASDTAATPLSMKEGRVARDSTGRMVGLGPG